MPGVQNYALHVNVKNKLKNKISMPNAFAVTMTRPHEALGLPQPFARRLPQGIVAWNLVALCATVLLSVLYVVQVNMAAAKGYALRDVQAKVDALSTENLKLQDKIATLSSLQSVSMRATELGFQPVDRLEFLDVTRLSYAMAR